MSKSDPTATEIARLRNASEWVQRLNESDDQALADRWIEWCRADAKNLATFEEMQRLWIAFPDVGTTSNAPPAANQALQRRGIIALAASLALLVAAAGWFASSYWDERVLETAIGEQHRVTLADGSGLDLAPGSLVSTHFTLARREVRLVRGEAYFSVAHSAVRPFVVHANGLKVTAVGTEFDVRISPSSTAVTVSEGRVTLAPVADGAANDSRTNIETVRAGAGQRIRFSQSAHRFAIATVNPQAAGAWRAGTLQFVGEPLEDVINAINRYTGPHVVVAPAFQQTRFTGTLSPSRVRDWLKALEQIYPVEIIDQGENEVLIRSRTHGN